MFATCMTPTIKIQGASGPYTMAGSRYIFYEASRHPPIRTTIAEALRQDLANLEVSMTLLIKTACMYNDIVIVVA